MRRSGVVTTGGNLNFMMGSYLAEDELGVEAFDLLCSKSGFMLANKLTSGLEATVSSLTLFIDFACFTICINLHKHIKMIKFQKM